jgi:hypothetical protein
VKQDEVEGPLCNCQNQEHCATDVEIHRSLFVALEPDQILEKPQRQQEERKFKDCYHQLKVDVLSIDHDQWNQRHKGNYCDAAVYHERPD